ncbi:hypothetical protein BGZ60DRAFT_535662 [Tricladium varicosporioides]|nr:hypothetical protein BGZ60DRAFT_535662 [Hymenoscyphus varicosporioides]
MTPYAGCLASSPHPEALNTVLKFRVIKTPFFPSNGYTRENNVSIFANFREEHQFHIAIMELRLFVLLILCFRLATGVFAGVGLGYFAAFMVTVKHAGFQSSFYTQVSIPIMAASISIIWNVFALATVRYMRPIWQGVGDLIMIALLAVLVPIGLHYIMAVYNTKKWFDVMPLEVDWWRRVMTGGVVLIASALTQACIAIINLWQHAHLKKEASRKRKGKGRAISDTESIASSRTSNAPSIPTSLYAVQPNQTPITALKTKRKNNPFQGLKRICTKIPPKLQKVTKPEPAVIVVAANGHPAYNSTIRFA